MNQEVIVVVRSVNERTADACVQSISCYNPGVLLKVVSRIPFEDTLRACYCEGALSNARWMITVDSDVLLAQDAIHKLLNLAQMMPDNCFQGEARLVDKLSGITRNVGHRIYRTKYLSAAIKLIPPAGEEIRPEYFTIQRMAELGNPSIQFNDVIGIHDYEQFYGDIYRKAFVHAQKHPEWLSRFVNRWRGHMVDDGDYLVALRGLYDGLMHTGQARIDKNFFSSLALNALKDLRLEEKDTFAYSADDVQHKISSIIKEYNQLAPLRQSPPTPPSRSKRILERAKEMGLARFLLYGMGYSLRRLGDRIEQSTLKR